MRAGQARQACSAGRKKPEWRAATALRLAGMTVPLPLSACAEGRHGLEVGEDDGALAPERLRRIGLSQLPLVVSHRVAPRSA